MNTLTETIRRRAFLAAAKTPLLLRPKVAEKNLKRFASLLGDDTPNLWQVQLGVIRMLHRVLYRSESIGNSSFPVRNTWRARLFHIRAVRLPVLVALRAVAPLDFSGLLSPTWRIQRHLLAAHHDGMQFVYDFELLAPSPGALEEVRAHAEDIVSGRDPRADAWRDVAIFERYHENLISAIDAFLAGEVTLSEEDSINPDLTLFAYLRWCASQPSTPEETWAAWRAGEYSIQDGVVAPRVHSSRGGVASSSSVLSGV